MTTTATTGPGGAGTDGAGASVAAAVLRFLRDELGCDRLFTVPGEAFLPLLGEAGAERVRVVTARHEAGAAFAALADARLTGRPGVVAVNRSPGATNASIAVDAAGADPTPLLLVVGGADRGADTRLAFQGTDIGALLGGIAPVVTVEGPEHVGAALAQVAGVLGAPVPGPAVLVVPEDVWSEKAAAAFGGAAAGAESGMGEAPDAARQAAGRVREALAAARRPVLVAGRLLRSGADGPQPALDRFARAADVPVLLGNKQQDLLDNDHPHYAGHLHLGTHATTRDRLADADLVVFLGERPDETHVQRWYDGGTTLLTVHPEPLGPGEHLAADPAAVLAHLADADRPGGRDAVAPDAGASHGADGADRADGAGCDDGGFGVADGPGWSAGWRALESGLRRARPRPRADGVDFAQVADALDRRLPHDVVVTLDAGNFSSWIHRHVRFGGGRRLLALAGGSMGFGVPAAVAAALRLPTTPVVAVVGDGGLLMTGNELATARAQGRCPVIVVADNAGYGTIHAHGARRYPGTDCATGLENPDLVAWARSFGLPAERVSEPHHVEPAVRRALAQPGGCLLHVRTSTQAVHANFDLPSAD